MKKLITLLAIVFFLNNLKGQCPPSINPVYSISSSSASFTLPCNPSVVTLDMVNTFTVPIFSYYVQPFKGISLLSSSTNTISFNFTLPGTYTITSYSMPFTACQVTQTVTIYPNALAPTVTVSPLSGTLSCSSSSVVFLANCSPTNNITGVWFQEYSILGSPPLNSEVPLSPPGTSITFTAGAVDLYAAVFTDNSTGCINVGRVNVVGSPITMVSMGASASPNAYLPCANNSVTISLFSNNTPNPVTYTFTNLSTSFSTTPANSSLVVTTPGYYRGEMIDGNLCKQFIDFYIGTNTIIPVVNITGNNKVCKGTSTTLTGNGTTSYTWSTGATTSTINVLPNSTTNYTITGMSGVCSGSAITTVSVDNTCSDVWPGDANSDGAANLLDILEIGLQSGFTGPARSYTSNAWQAFFANNWTGTITTGKNKCHADCDGDGTVTATDANAITTNWGLTHTFKLNEEAAVNPDLSIIPDQPLVQIGTWGTASIYLGDVSNNINLYGLAFDVNHNNTLVQTDSIYVEYINSFLNTGGTNIELQKEIFSSSAVYAASTRIDHADVNGNGKIGILHFKAVSTLSNNAILNINLSNATKSNANGNFNSLTSGVGSVTITTSAIGINELNKFESNISLYPQPASNIVNIISSHFYDKKIEIKITDVTGKTIRHENLEVNTGKAQLLTSEFSNGVYILQIKNSQNQIAVKRFIISR